MRNTVLMLSLTAALSGIAAAAGLIAGAEDAQRAREAGGSVSAHGSLAGATPALVANRGGLLFGANRQVNDPLLDSIETFDGTRPFVNASNADASIAAYRQNLVTVFSTSGARMLPAGGGFAFERNLQIGYAYSSDGGRSWNSAHLPSLPERAWTGGFRAFANGYGIVDVDRHGRFYVGAIALDAGNRWALTLNKSVDGGKTFSPAQAIDTQAGRIQKPWIAIGPDPIRRTRDNVYLSWSGFSATAFSSVLRFARSTDGGNTFTTRTIFAPPPDPEFNNPQDLLDYSTLAVDKFTGKIYIALLNFGFVNADYLRILVSDDGGDTFSLLKFNRPGAPDAEVLPVIQPGTLVECGAAPDGQGGFSPYTPLALHAGDDIGGSVSTLPRYTQASRLVLQPALAVSKGVIHLTWSNSTSATYGDPGSGADVLYMRSLDDGHSWSEPVVVSERAAPTQRSVMPAIAIGRFQGETALPFLPSPKDVHISYYAQRSDGKVVMNIAHSRDRGASFPPSLKRQLSQTAFALPPSNIPLPVAGNPYQTTHYNRNRAECSALGDYTGLALGFGRLHAAWGDTRNTIRQPDSPFDPISGQTHPKEDVFHASPLIR